MMKLLNRRAIGTLAQTAITHVNDSYTHKVKETWNQEKAAVLKILVSGVLLHESQQKRFEPSSWP